MLFHSSVFLFGFLPLVLLGFVLLARAEQHAAAKIFLVLASLFFYAWWSWPSLALIGASIGFNFWCGSRLGRGGAGTDAALAARRRRALLAFGIAVNLGALAYFKYSSFLLNSAAQAVGATWQLAPLTLPLAISFFTFQQITYVVDAYRDQAPRRDFVSYCLFVTFFPQLIAGPILQYRHTIALLTAVDAFTLHAGHVAEGLFVFAIGLFKKVVLADTFGPWVGRVFDGAGVPAFGDAWGAMLAFALQVYFDFSGYSDMAVGLGLLFNVRLPENFDSPYKAQSIIDFWRRWHMTLAAFLRDYLYIPLGGNRSGQARQFLSLMITMLLGGLWHGASWTFVAWGGLQGVLLSINHLWRRVGIALPGPLAWALTFTSVLIGFVFVCAHSFAQASTVLASMFGLHGIGAGAEGATFGSHEYKRIAAGLALVLWCPNRQAIMRWPWRSDVVYAIVFSLLFGISVLTLANPVPFYYFQF